MPEKDADVSDHLAGQRICGLVLKPWGERKRTVFQIMPEVQALVNSIPGIRTTMATPPALPGGGNFPVEFVISATAEPEQILSVRPAVAAGGRGQRHVRLPADD